jgi:hypothetical protein
MLSMADQPADQFPARPLHRPFWHLPLAEAPAAIVGYVLASGTTPEQFLAAWDMSDDLRPATAAYLAQLLPASTAAA